MYVRSSRGIAAALALTALSSLSSADSITIEPDRDNTLIQTEGEQLSQGASYNFYVGRVGTNGGGLRRRGMLHFDIVAALPPGAIVSAVTLKLHVVQSSAGPKNITLRRCLEDWGEGDSFGYGGAGAPATPGDCTWTHTFYPDALWSTLGGTYDPTISASKSVGGIGFYTWGSTAGMVADVQNWLDGPATNFGWCLIGDESTIQTVKKFDSRENEVVSVRPKLTITYTPPAPITGDINGDGLVDGADLGLLLGAWNTADPDADLDGNGVVDGADLGMLLGAWGTGD